MCAEVLSQAQQQVVSAGAQSISGLLNVSSSQQSARLSHVLNAVAAVQLQLSALDCASYDCGEGSCVLVGYTPTCNCDGTEYTGPNCQLSGNMTSGSSGQGVCVCLVLLLLLSYVALCM